MPQRFQRRGTTKVWYVPSIAASTKIPTAAEVNAGTNITDDIAEMNGFTYSNQPISVPDMGSTFENKIPGGDTVEDSNMVFYEDKNASPVVFAALVKDAVGFIVIFYRGIAGSAPAANDKCDVWPVTIASKSRMFTAENEAAKYQVVFTGTDDPAVAVAVAA